MRHIKAAASFLKEKEEPLRKNFHDKDLVLSFEEEKGLFITFKGKGQELVSKVGKVFCLQD